MVHNERSTVEGRVVATRRKRRRRSWITAPDVAERIGLDVRAVRELLEAGEFPGAFRRGTGAGIGKHWRIPRADVDSYLERRARAVQERRDRDAHEARAAVIRRKPGER